MAKLRRRQFILGAVGTAGALVIGWLALPERRRLVPAKPLAAGPGQFVLNGWVKLSSNGAVSIVVSQAEMGQGAHTGLAMLLADEMDADWSRVTLEQSTLDAIYNNQAAIIDSLPFAPEDHGLVKRAARHLAGKLIREMPGLQITGGSSSIKNQWLPMREAGASARAMLIAAAAAQWRVPVAECRAESGRVLHPSGCSAGFGELAASAATMPLPGRVTLKDPSRFKLIGRPMPRIDTAPKINGGATFGIDVAPPGVLHAAIAMCPTVGGRVARFDAAAALAMPGVRKAIEVPPVPGGSQLLGETSGGVAVIADTQHRAQRALAQVQIEWDHGPASGVSTTSAVDAMLRALDTQEGRVHFARGDAAAAMHSAAKIIDAEYRVPYLAHSTMEPMNCTAQFKNGAATVWAPTQAAGFANDAVAKALGIKGDKIDVKVPYLGGGFGRRFLTDVVVQAALLARETDGAPVKLLWSREQDMTHDYYRPAYVCRCRAGFDGSGNLLAWVSTSAGSSMGAPAFVDGAADGATNTGYAFPAARIAHQPVESPVPVGVWRSVAHSQNAFFVESFIDECAAASGKDPVAFRADLLRASGRELRVLTRAAELGAWGQGGGAAADGAKLGRGIALHRCFGSVVAQVADVSVRPDGRIRVHRVICVVDCGTAVNPNLIRQQMESGIVFGLSAALRGEITFEKGQVQQSNFHDYSPLRIDECPLIEVDIIQSADAPGGVGEPGTPPIAPAVANAVFALTGRRLRSLPLKFA